MTDYQGPFRVAHVRDYGLAFCDKDGRVLDASDAEKMLNELHALRTGIDAALNITGYDDAERIHHIQDVHHHWMRRTDDANRAEAELHALKARTCESCRHNEPRQTRSMGMTFDTPWCRRWNMWRPCDVNSCSAHAPKEAR